MNLRDLKINESAVITKVGGEGALRQHFLDMGLIPGTLVTVVRLAPLGDPMELMLKGYGLSLRLADAEQIEVALIQEPAPSADNADARKPAPSTDNADAQRPVHSVGNVDAQKPAFSTDNINTRKTTPSVGNATSRKPISSADNAAAPYPHVAEHPGLGEGGRFHPKGTGNPLPEGTTLTFALVGNQNSGKTTLFNQLTGSNQHVGNFPGVTVDRKDGVIRNRANTLVTDLPGIYSMSPYTSEELVSRNFVLREHPKAIINIVDATNVERNLYLTMQLMEMNVPMVVALNMMDEVTGNGGSIDVNTMEALLGVPVLPISAAKNHGVDELIDHAVHIASYQERPLRQDFCDESDHGGAVHRCIHAIIHLIDDHAVRAGLPVRFAASKLIEGDNLILEQLELDQNEKEMLEHIIVQMEKEMGMDRCAAMADMRFAFIGKVCSATVRKPVESKERVRSQQIDRILTGKYTAIPMFILIMGIVSLLTFNVIGPLLQDLLAAGIEQLTAVIDSALTAAHVNEVIRGLVVDGILEGVGSVVSFLPIIITLFFFLSILEDSGYIARVAFFMDKLLRKMGLSGRSIVPMLIGFGCSVPAVMATRTLPSERDRKMTILLTPFMSCSAKMPIYAFFVSAFFPRQGGLIIVALYLLGIVMGILAALLYKDTLFRGEAAPFVMELPNYRLPGLKSVLLLLWEKAKDFLQRAFSVILIATIVVWFLQSFDLHFNLADADESILALLSGRMVPLLKPIGLGDWRICVSLITGFMAKESVVSTMEILFPGGIGNALSTLTAASLLVFSLLYTPCVAAIASIRRELGGKWAVAVVLWQCFVAWIAAGVVYWIGSMM